MEKLNRGITLVALVITIILLLILAGISLGMATGENGLIEKAKLSVSSYKQSQSDEEKKIDLLSQMLDPNSINSDSGNVGINCNCGDKLELINQKINNQKNKLEELEKNFSTFSQKLNNFQSKIENYNPAVELHGSLTKTLNGSSSYSEIITFEKFFNEIPTVTVASSRSAFESTATDVTQTSFKLTMKNKSSNQNLSNTTTWSATAPGFNE